MNDYSLIDTNTNYNQDAVRQLAAAMNELKDISRRERYLRRIVSDNSKLKRFVWTTKAGQAIAYPDITNDHLINIIKLCILRDEELSDELEAEMTRRNINLDGQPAALPDPTENL